MSKENLRKKFKLLLDELDTVYKNNASQKIISQIITSSQYQSSKTIFVYVSTKNEVQTHEFIRLALNDNKSVVVPRCISNGIMEAHYIYSLKDLYISNYGILEPKFSSPLASKDDIDLAIIPCLAANKEGFRLGHGGGYYDRYLSGTSFFKILIAFNSQVINYIPTDKYDIPCDTIIFDK